jgi:hypothetical protein
MATKRIPKAGPEARRRAYENQQAAMAERHADLIARLTEKAAADPDGIWSELLAEATA